MIRRGNHFLNLDGLGWVLIDGPWFRYLDRWERNYVQLACLEANSVGSVGVDGSSFLAYDFPLEEATYSQVIWERVRWHPGTIRVVWWRALGRRIKYGWRVMPDGPLPAYLNRVEYSFELDHTLREMEEMACRNVE